MKSDTRKQNSIKLFVIGKFTPKKFTYSYTNCVMIYGLLQSRVKLLRQRQRFDVDTTN